MSKQHPTHDDLYPDSAGRFRDLVPQGTKHYLREKLKFDDYTQTLVLELIEMGEHLYVAAQIAGVEQATLATWVRKGRVSKDPTDAYFKFFERYKHARLRGLALLREKQRRRRADPQGYGDEPRMNSFNSLPYHLFSEQNREAVLDNVRSGMFPGVAAEAAGIPAQVLVYWVSEGRAEMQAGHTDGDFYAFYIDYIKIAAQTRGNAETRVYEDMPLAWLLHGVGRDTPDAPGWTKQSQVVGAGGGPVQIETSWRTAASPIQVEGSAEPTLIASPQETHEE